MQRAWGITIRDGYGQTETTALVGNAPGLPVKPGSMGKPLPGYDVVLLDSAGRETDEGEVALRLSPRPIGLMHAYLDDPARTDAATSGGFYRTGDEARRDADGYVTYIGRADDALKVRGKWLLTSELEGCLAEHPAVRECAVVGVADQGGLTKPVAFVVADGEDDRLEPALQQHVLERLEAYKHPRRVFIVDALPRTHLGKVDRAALKAGE